VFGNSPKTKKKELKEKRKEKARDFARRIRLVKV
jgi:hypothetical protein